MSVPVSIAGLGQSIPEMPDSCVILVEGTVDCVKSVFVQSIGHSALSRGRRVVYVTSRASREVVAEMSRHLPSDAKFALVEGFSPDSLGENMVRKGVLIIDSFSYIMMDKDLDAFRNVLALVKSFSRTNESLVLLTSDVGMLTEKCNMVAWHIVDGVIQFMTREVPEGVVRFMRIPKWVDGRSLDRNIYYTFDGACIKVDLRSRVL